VLALQAQSPITHPNIYAPSLTGGDDAPAIITAFRNCGHGGSVVSTNHTYHINSVMNTTGLSNCRVELHGTLLVCILILYLKCLREN
jgi:galacturan 1,4-alpha-galacturonidase